MICMWSPFHSTLGGFLLSFLTCFYFMCEVSASSGACAGRNGLSTTTTGISLLDVWAGVSAFSDGFSKQAHVPVMETVWIENAPAAIALLSAIYPAAKCCKDFYDYTWRRWNFKYDLVVAGGPSCCPFSLSGKRLRQYDERSTQGLDTADLAVYFGATMLIIENVVPFLEEDHWHNLVSEMTDFLSLNGYVLAATWYLVDSALGGCSGRRRVFLVWESVEMASMLCAWPEPPPPIAPASLSSCLEPWADTEHLEVKGQSEFIMDGPFQWEEGQAQRVGSLWIRGPEHEWMEGEAVKFEDDHRIWRIIQLTRQKARLIFDSRSQPKFQWVKLSDMCFSHRHWIEWPVYSTHGVAIAIRHTSFAPGDLTLITEVPGM